MRVIISDKHFLSRTGLEHIIQKHFPTAKYITSCIEGFQSLAQQIKTFQPDIVLLDYISMNISAEKLQVLILKYPSVKFILITDWLPKTELMRYFRINLKWHLLKECDEQEIKECIEYACNNQSFFCNKLIQFIQSENSSASLKARKKMDCSGTSITQREKEIIRCVAEGMSNKQIADALHISIHTVLTHRKNIMRKTHTNNTAGLILFALKNNILHSSNHFLFAENDK